MAITRRMIDGNVLNPEQRISRFDALKMWTLNNAYLMFAEKDSGSIGPGKLADMVIISKDFATCPEDDMKSIEALKTVVGGRVVFDSSHVPTTASSPKANGRKAGSVRTGSG
jgi:predicted amidohydrolase YtcJ